MRVIGLTGSIGMGKSTAATLLRRDGIAVCDADAIVHQLLGRCGKAVPDVLAAFPTTGDGVGGIDRARLGAAVFLDESALRRLEGILHPLVRSEKKRFLTRSRRLRRAVVVLDVPLLFESGGDRECDDVIVVTAPRFLQRQRVLRRRGMTPERFAAIERQQLPDSDKRRRTRYLIPSGIGKRETLRCLRRAVHDIVGRPA